MKLNIASPIHGTNICTEVTGNNERLLYGKSLGDIIDAGIFNPEYAGWKVLFTGGSDKQGFPMDASINTDKRQRLLRKKGNIGYKPLRNGERKRKSVRGSVVSEETAVLCMKLINDAMNDKATGLITEEVKHIEGLTDNIVQNSHLPKRFTKLKKLFFGENADNLNSITVQDVKQKVKSVVQIEEGSKKKMPRLRITRTKSPQIEQRMKKRADKKQKRKERSTQIREEYLKKYPDWKIAQ